MMSEDFAKRLAKACANHADCPTRRGSGVWLQRELAAEGINVSGQCVSNWQHGRTVPREHTLAVLSKILNVERPWLLGLEQETTQNTAVGQGESHSLRISLGASRSVEINGIPSDFTVNEATKVAKLMHALAV